MIAALFTHAGARLVCLVQGHRRGQRISPTHVRCPRCKREAPRAEKKKAA